MISPTEADIGRRVVYAPPVPDYALKGVLVALDGRWAGIAYDPTQPPIWTGPHDLHWAEDWKPARKGKAA